MAEDKVYRIGEVAAELQLKTSVLRFWESEFPELVPKRSAKGHRSYNAQDVELLKRIKQLLHEQGMTIEGAKRVLHGEGAEPGSLAVAGSFGGTCAKVDRAFLEAIIADLHEVRSALSQSDACQNGEGQDDAVQEVVA
ncbi:MAG: MerR family transcriptional regulator [Desulfovibrio sp.]|nr:MerR family transcriptional regulator [Desulfovibrio sp.]